MILEETLQAIRLYLVIICILPCLGTVIYLISWYVNNK